MNQQFCQKGTQEKNLCNIRTWICFFGTITRTMITAMIESSDSSDSHSDSEDSDSPQLPPFNFHTKFLNPKLKSPKYQPKC